MGKSDIEWTDNTWNPISGCTPCSPGCQNCYARALINRYKGRKGWPESPDDITFFPERLEQPKHWKEPKRIFVCSMSDFFHPKVKLSWQVEIIHVMMQCPQHTFMILTKREDQLDMYNHVCGFFDLPNRWLGVTVENQEYANIRIPALLKCDVQTKFVSVEPMLGPIDLTHIIDEENQLMIDSLHGKFGAGSDPGLVYPHLDWVICGAETGSKARPMNPDWARALRDQCVEADIPFFLKKLSDGTRELDGQMWEQYPREAKEGE